MGFTKEEIFQLSQSITEGEWEQIRKGIPSPQENPMNTYAVPLLKLYYLSLSMIEEELQTLQNRNSQQTLVESNHTDVSLAENDIDSEVTSRREQLMSPVIKSGVRYIQDHPEEYAPLKMWAEKARIIVVLDYLLSRTPYDEDYKFSRTLLGRIPKLKKSDQLATLASTLLQDGDCETLDRLILTNTTNSAASDQNEHPSILDSFN